MKELISIVFISLRFMKNISLYNVYSYSSYFLFGIEGGIWVLIVPAPCYSFLVAFLMKYE